MKCDDHLGGNGDTDVGTVSQGVKLLNQIMRYNTEIESIVSVL